MAGSRDRSLSALRGGAELLADALKLGSALLGSLADVLHDLADTGSKELRDSPERAAVPTPEGVVSAREGELVAPEGFLRRPRHDRPAPGVEDVRPAAPVRPASRRPPAASARPARDAGQPAPGDPPPREEPSAAQPAPEHVDEEAVVVGEFADPGAQNGAGAEVHIEEPWHGYQHLKASEVIDRLVAEPDDVISLVLLFEPAHRARRTIIGAAERELARRTAHR